MDKDNIIKSIIAGSICAVAFIFLITILGELSPGVKNWLAQTYTHHWIGKSMLSIAVFLIFTLLFMLAKIKMNLVRLIWMLTITVNSASVLLLVFFVWETFLR